MENEVGYLVFHDPMHAKNQSLYDSISSWLDMDNTTTPYVDDHNTTTTFPQDLLMLDDDLFFQFAESNNVDSATAAPSNDPDLRSAYDSLLAELLDFEPDPHNSLPAARGNGDEPISDPVAPTISTSMGTDDADAANVFLNDDTYLITPAESPESFTYQFFSTSSPTASPSYYLRVSSDPPSKKRRKIERKAKVREVVEYEDEEEVESEEEPRGSAGRLNCKNLVSERNRRKRLSQQLLALRALVPNITKMDKRSVLVDALAYLKGIQKETARLQSELKRKEEKENQNSEAQQQQHQQQNHHTSTLPQSSKQNVMAQILEIDTERMEDRRFVVKITCRGDTGVGGKVLRLIESVGFDITYTSIEKIRPQHILTTAFIRVKRHGRMTEGKLKECITAAALRSGLSLRRNLQ